jgi:hypothetical protein
VDEGVREPSELGSRPLRACAHAACAAATTVSWEARGGACERGGDVLSHSESSAVVEIRKSKTCFGRREWAKGGTGFCHRDAHDNDLPSLSRYIP